MIHIGIILDSIGIRLHISVLYVCKLNKYNLDIMYIFTEIAKRTLECIVQQR